MTLIAGCASVKPDAVSGATRTMSVNPIQASGSLDPGGSIDPCGSVDPCVLIVLESADNGATAKIARAIAGELEARIITPEQATADEIQKYDLVGFGSGIFSQRHHRALFDLADRLQVFAVKKAFIISTSGVSRQFALDHKTDDTHTPLREALQKKGFSIAGEFNCEGFNDNSFLRLFGGMNKGRPNAGDIENAKRFAAELKAAF